jgi:ABC-type transporter Mla maintaining outer membrane lipid asymmetry ATPase subunit MlaF
MSGTKEPCIVAKDLTMAFGSFVLQRDLNFTVNRGDIFIIMGGSGCGKSTLLRHLVGLQTPAKGQVSAVIRSGNRFERKLRYGLGLPGGGIPGA